MIQPIAQPFTARTAVIRQIGMAFQQHMPTKTAEFRLAAKTLGVGMRRADMHDRFPKGAPNIKAERGRQVARIHRKTAIMAGLGATARRRRTRKNCLGLGQSRFSPILISAPFYP
jgi:hypothetical protein